MNFLLNKAIPKSGFIVAFVNLIDFLIFVCQSVFLEGRVLVCLIPIFLCFCLVFQLRFLSLKNHTHVFFATHVCFLFCVLNNNFYLSPSCFSITLSRILFVLLFYQFVVFTPRNLGILYWANSNKPNKIPA